MQLTLEYPTTPDYIRAGFDARAGARRKIKTAPHGGSSLGSLELA